jgi:hypothetical protein
MQDIFMYSSLQMFTQLTGQKTTVLAARYSSTTDPEFSPASITAPHRHPYHHITGMTYTYCSLLHNTHVRLIYITDSMFDSYGEMRGKRDGKNINEWSRKFSARRPWYFTRHWQADEWTVESCLIQANITHQPHQSTSIRFSNLYKNASKRQS